MSGRNSGGDGSIRFSITLSIQEDDVAWVVSALTLDVQSTVARGMMDTCSPRMLSQVAYMYMDMYAISGCIHTWTCTYLRLHILFCVHTRDTNADSSVKTGCATVYLTYVGSIGGSPSPFLGVRTFPLLSLQKGNSEKEKARAWSSSCLATS